MSRKVFDLITSTGGAAALRCLVALGFLAGFLAIGIGTATTVSSPSVPYVEGCILYAVGLVVILELRPALVALRSGNAALRLLRHQLDALPETPHPLDRAARPRSNR